MTEKRWRVLIASRSFGQASADHLTQLEAAGCELILNPSGRAYKAAALLPALQNVDAIITGTDELTAEVIRSANRLKTIAKHGVGLDNIDLAAADACGVVVSYTPGAIHDSVADLTLTLLLALARQIVPLHQRVRAGGWQGSTGMELRDKTLGIVGLGRIGKAVCQRAQAFGMKIIAHDPYPDQVYAAAHEVEFLPLADLLLQADVVTLHAVAADPHRPLIGAAELALMKASAYLINTARGQLVDEAVLAEALRNGNLAGAGLDVFASEPPGDSPLFHLENVVLTPHIGGRTDGGLRRMGQITLENCLLALQGQAPHYQAKAGVS